MASRTLAWLVLSVFVAALALRLHAHTRAGSSDTLVREQAAYKELREAIRARFVREIDERDERKLFYGAMQGMTEALQDKHSHFLPPDEYEHTFSSIRGQFEGVGMECYHDSASGLTVLTPILGSPAWRSGVLPGDRILKIDGQPTESSSYENAIQRIRGPLGSEVRLTLERGDPKEIVELTLQRAVIELKSVQSAEILDLNAPLAVTRLAGSVGGGEAGQPRIGYVQVVQFQQNTAADLDAALKRLEGQGMAALILDLRQNRGGSLEAAEKVSDLFLKDGVIVSVVTRAAAAAGSAGSIRYAQAEGTHPDYPVAVLVDSLSASASEIVAGALKERGRATLVGDRTFGKFSVQEVIEVPMGDWGSGALKLTTARYETPNGPHVDGEGIFPDYLVPSNLEQQRGLLDNRRLRYLNENNPHPERPLKALPGAPAQPFDDRQLKKAIEVVLGALGAPPKPPAGAEVRPTGNAKAP